jgi:hypothetical protein
MAKFTKLRLSLVWVHAFPDLLLMDSQRLQATAMPFLGARAQYNGAFRLVLRLSDPPRRVPAGSTHVDESALNSWPDLLRQRDAVKGLARVTAPWTRLRQRSFWTLYAGSVLELREEAWRILVPFRAAQTFRIQVPGGAPWAQTKTALELYYYPFGTGLIVTFYLEGVQDNVDLIDLADALRKLRHSRQFRPGWVSAAPEALSLDEIASLMSRRASQELGAGSHHAEWWTSTPFSLFTVVAAGNRPHYALTPGGTLHRFFETVTTWKPVNKRGPLPALEKRVVGLWTESEPDIVYGSTYGRAIWMPDMCAPDPTRPKQTNLACYHRNLTHGILQTQACCSFTSLLHQAATAGLGRNALLREVAYNVATNSYMLWYACPFPVYRSKNLKRQIEETAFGSVQKTWDEYLTLM